MDIIAIAQAVCDIGFPAVFVFVVLIMWQRESERHKEEMNNITKALNDNTLVMHRLLDRLEGGGWHYEHGGNF